MLAEGRSPYYAAAWEGLLSGPKERLYEVLVADTDDARALRQATPFAGVIGPRERWSLWKGVREDAAGR
jgi:hypothetical protein